MPLAIMNKWLEANGKQGPSVVGQNCRCQDKHAHTHHLIDLTILISENLRDLKDLGSSTLVKSII